jgi:ATP-binding cassette subfamily C protein
MSSRLDHDVHVEVAERLAAETKEPLSVTGRDLLALQPPERVWVILRGGVDVFATNPSDPNDRARTHVFRAMAGHLLMGLGDEEGHGIQLVAAGLPGTQLAAYSWDELKKHLSADELTHLVDAWTTSLAGALEQGLPPRGAEILPDGDEVGLEADQVARGDDHTIWLEVAEGRLEVPSRPFDSEALPGRAFPFAPGDWIQATQPSRVKVVDLAELISNGSDALLNFNRRALSSLAEMRIAGDVSEKERLKKKSDVFGRQVDTTLKEIVGSLNPKQKKVATATNDEDELFAAFSMVAEAEGVPISQPPARVGPARNPIVAMAKACKVRTRPVSLRDEWWTTDAGALLGFKVNEDYSDRPVALVPVGDRTYELHDPRDGSIIPVDATVAEGLRGQAHQVYRPLPLDKPISGWDLIRFGLHGKRKDVTTMIVAGVVIGLLALLPPIFTGYLFNFILPAEETGLVGYVGFALIASALAVAAFTVGQGIAIARLGIKSQLHIEAAMVDRLVNLSPSFFRNYSAGDLALRVTGIEQILQAVSSTVITSILAVVFSVFQLVLMFLYSPLLALVAVGLLIIATAYIAFIGRRQIKSTREIVKLDRELNSSLVQIIQGIPKLRVAGAESRVFARMAKRFLQKNQATVKQQRIFNGLTTFTTTYTVISSLVLYSTVAFFDWDSGRGSNIDAGTFLAFNSAFTTVLIALLNLTSSFQSFATAGPVYKQMKPILQALPEIDDAKADPGELTGHIEMQGVTFRYAEDGPIVLHDVSFTVAPGEFVALVGPSGSGKSTCLRMLLGFDQPEQGKVFYDGQDLEGLDLQSVRQQLGVVMQGGSLMQGALWENIVGASGGTIDDAWEGAKAAGLDEDIKAMPMGMHTMLNAGATTISGGQRQRMLIARALVGKPRIILFDEATSALDNESQLVVSQSLESLQSTRVVIAHRLSTIRGADKIIVMVQGKVVEVGNYEELMAKHGAFYEIASRQIV